MTSEDQGNAGRVEGNGRRDSIGFISLGHVLGGHNEDLMAVDRAGHMGLRPPDHDAVFSFFDNMREQIRIGLFTGTLGPVTLGVRHAADDHEIFLLDHLEKLNKTGKVFRPVGRVDFVSGHVQGSSWHQIRRTAGNSFRFHER